MTDRAIDGARPEGLEVAAQGELAPDGTAEVGALDLAEVRARAWLRRFRYVVYAAFGVLALTVVVEVWRAPTDVLAVVQLVVVALLAAALVTRHELNLRLLRRRTEHEAGQAQILQGISRSVSADAIVDSIVNALRRSADADHVVVARLRPVERVVETTLVSSRALVPPSRSVLPAQVLDPDRATRRRSRRRRTQVVSGKDSERAIAASLAAQLADAYALSYTLAAPLVTGERVVGALILSRRQDREWTPADRRLLEFSAQELSVALARAFTYEEAEIRANIDALTGLPNRRYLEEVLATVGPRRRSADRLGALMIDLDHFKRLNDRYGHAAGDRVLRAVGERISAAVRADDTPARYGGEEFAVVLRRADPQQALEVGERIRAQIGEMSQHELGIGEGLTVSVGVAVAASHVTDPVALLRSADEALYRAKREGRNRVVLAATST